MRGRYRVWGGGLGRGLESELGHLLCDQGGHVRLGGGLGDLGLRDGLWKEFRYFL
jgi:hypothetical protein